MGWDKAENRIVDPADSIDETPNIKESTAKQKFEFKEATASDKIVITIFGEKGSGKTMTAFGLSGNKSVLCFDEKAQMLQKHFFKDDKSLKVYDAIEFFTKDPDHYLDSSQMTYEYILFLLDNINKEKPDWVMIDGLEILTNICEMVMRRNHGLKPYQGIANMSIWRERRQLLDSIHKKALNCAKKGLIYTTYCDDEKIIEEGAIIVSRKIPKWTDSVLYVTDITLHVENHIDKAGQKITVKVNNSKIPSFLKTGQIIDLTNKKLREFIKS